MASAQEKLYAEEDYYAIPEGTRAELINGRIYYQAAPSRIHQEILSFLHSNIYNYIHAKKGPCKIYPAPFAVKPFADDDTTIVEPDISVICDPGKLTDRGCTGAPDWIIEIVSPGNPGNDYIRKLNLYLDAGVREYWIVNPKNHTVFVYNLEEATYESISHTFQEDIKAGIFDGLSICLKEFTHL